MFYLNARITDNRLPDAFADNVVSADCAALKVGVYFLQRLQATPDELGHELHLSHASVLRAIQFWLDNYLISETPAVLMDQPLTPYKTPEPVKASKKALNHQEMAEAVLANPELSVLLQESQQVLGKELSNSESMRLVSIYQEYLPSPFAILNIESFWASHIPTNKILKETEYTAREWKELGIGRTDEVEERIAVMEKNMAYLKAVSGLLGEEVNEMSRKTKRMIIRWLEEYHYPIEFVKEVLIRKEDANVPYIDSVLKGWHKKGYTKISDTRETPVNVDEKKSNKPAVSLIDIAIKKRNKKRH